MKPVEKIGGGFTRALASEKGLCRSKILRNSSPLLLCDFFIYGCIFLGHLERELDSETARQRDSESEREAFGFPLTSVGVFEFK